MKIKEQVYQACKEDPSSIFTYMKQGEYDLVEELLLDNYVSINVLDGVGNDVVTRLLKAKQYELVLELMKKRNWDVNHQNDDGNTFGHILAQDDSVMALKVMEQLTKKKNYIPNIQNKNGETAMDIAISNNYLCTAFKLLEDKRFNHIDVFCFKNLFNISIKNRYFGKYSKITNLEIIVENLEKKELNLGMQNLVDNINNNMDAIKKDFMNNKSSLLESIINRHLVME